MDLSWKPLFLLVIGLSFAFSAKAGPQLPQSLIGYYRDQDNRLVVLQRDFFYLEDMISKSGYYQEVEENIDGAYTVFIRQHSNQSRLLKLNLRPTTDGLAATLKDYREQELSLRAFQPTVNSGTTGSVFPMAQGQWYCNSDNLEVEIKDKQMTIAGEVFQLVENFQAVDDQQLRQYYLLESDTRQQFVARPLSLNEQYFGWNILDRYYEHCRTILDIPYGNSDLYEDLPVHLVGNWESSGPGKVNISFYPDYSFSYAKRKAKIKRLSNLPTRKSIHLEVELGDERLLWSISPTASNELLITDLATKDTTTFYQVSEIADFVGDAEVEVEEVPILPWAIGVAMGLIIAIIVILRTRSRNRQNRKEFV